MYQSASMSALVHLYSFSDEDRITDHGSDSESEESEGGGELYGNSIPPVGIVECMRLLVVAWRVYDQ